MKRKPITLLFYGLALMLSSTLFAQDKIRQIKIDTAHLPIGIKYEASIQNAIRWVDSIGDNIVVITETGVIENKKFNNGNEGWDAELFGYHFLIDEKNTRQTWKVYDFIKDCPVEVEAAFIKNTLQVTDLNHNGVGEVWLMYKTACHGDISPCDMKIIMYEGDKKFAMRGQNKVKVAEQEYIGGEYKFDTAFNENTRAFKEFALKLWNKNIMQIWSKN